MDWSNVTFEELLHALKEAEWSSPPRPLSEFFAKFAAPTTFSKWSNRLKCNLYVYRANYFIVINLMLILCSAVLRCPTSFMGAIFASFGIACLNDSFAISLSARVMRIARRAYPPLAAKMRAPPTPGGQGRPSKGIIYICGKDRRIVLIGLISVSMLMWFLSSTLKAVLVSLASGLILTLIHASFRTPNFKARLNTFREDFRTVWRSYSDPWFLMLSSWFLFLFPWTCCLLHDV